MVYNATGLTWDLYLEDELVGSVWPDQTWSTGAGYRFSLRMESNCAITGTSYTLYESGNIPDCGETCIDILP